jgi:hypothetical protein
MSSRIPERITFATLIKASHALYLTLESSGLMALRAFVRHKKSGRSLDRFKLLPVLLAGIPTITLLAHDLISKYPPTWPRPWHSHLTHFAHLVLIREANQDGIGDLLGTALGPVLRLTGWIWSSMGIQTSWLCNVCKCPTNQGTKKLLTKKE